MALYEINLEEINQSYRGWLELERGPLLALPLTNYSTTFKFRTSLVTNGVIYKRPCVYCMASQLLMELLIQDVVIIRMLQDIGFASKEALI